MMCKADIIVSSTAVFRGKHAPIEHLAIALTNDRIVAIDTPENIGALKGPHTVVYDFGDGFICPGLHDSHVHFFHSALYSSPLAENYLGTSEADYVAHLQPLAARRPHGSWILAQGWREYRWNPARLPSKSSLDRAFPHHPVALYSGDAHTLWLNGNALDTLGIDEDSIAPEGGSYDKDERGCLTGIVREAAAMALMPRIVADFSVEELLDAYRDQLKRLAAAGITSVCDMSLMAAPGLDFVRDDLFESLLKKDELTCRVNLFPTLLAESTRLADCQQRLTHPLLQASGYKQFFDGVSSQHTAWLEKPYSNASTPDDCGRPTVPVATMRALILQAAREQQPVRIHTIGDQAIHSALDCFEEARQTYGTLPKGKHNCLEHLENFQQRDLARLAQLDVVAAVQPPHITLDPGGPEQDLGAQRVSYMWPFETLIENGTTLAFGTDSPVVNMDPRRSLYTAITRQDATTHLPLGGWLPEQRISAVEALSAYTEGSARAAQRRNELGVLEPGMLADIAVFDTNLITCEAQDILNAETLATFVGGKRVF